MTAIRFSTNYDAALDQWARPLHSGWVQLQSMSGVSSIASHWALQYFLPEIMQVQLG
jgi:hypothetical protein